MSDTERFLLWVLVGHWAVVVMWPIGRIAVVKLQDWVVDR